MSQVPRKKRARLDPALQDQIQSQLCRFRRRIFAMATFGDPEDLFQDVFLRCLGLNHSTIDWTQPQFPLICRVVRYVRIDNLRKNLKCHASRYSDGDLEDAEFEQVANERSLLDECEYADTCRRLKEALCRLESGLRSSVEHHFFKFVPDHEIAAELHVDENTVRRWRNSAIGELRAVLADQTCHGRHESCCQ